MRIRPAARLLIVDPSHRLLLFRFTHSSDALAGRRYWATPGGGVEEGESFEQAAVRELYEETGIVREQVGEIIAQRTFQMRLPSGEEVTADERFYLVRTDSQEISATGWSEHENTVISDYRWWDLTALRHTAETVYPADIPEMYLQAST